MTTSWLITDKGDQDARRLADGHYTRQTPGARQFTRNGQNLVFLTECADAVWVTFRPTPGKAKRADGLDAWECALFRNTGPLLSSALIREAVELSVALWGPLPPDGMITFVRPECVSQGRADHVAGYCYRRAGWRHKKGHQASDGKPRLVAPRPRDPRHWRCWEWRGDRGGKLRRELED